jgi:hypothetical protein
MVTDTSLAGSIDEYDALILQVVIYKRNDKNLKRSS